MPFTSVVIPAYNVGPYVGECLASVCRQSCADWECICVDDGSTDGSGILMDDMVRRDGRIRVVHRRNGGVSLARNWALGTFTGDFVWFVDADDLLVPGAMAILKETVTRYAITPQDVVDFDFRVGENRAPEALPPPVPDAEAGVRMYDMVDAGDLSSYLTRMRLSTIWHMLWGREVVKPCRFRPYRLTEDTLFAYSAALRARRVCQIGVRAYYYYRRQGSASAVSSLVKVMDRANALEELFSLLANRSDTTDHLRHLIDREWCVQGLWWIERIENSGERREAMARWMGLSKRIRHLFHSRRLQALLAIYAVGGLWGIGLCARLLGRLLDRKAGTKRLA